MTLAHDNGEKTVLGQKIPAGGGEQDVDRLVDIVCDHPATARHIATKLVQRFVADEPPAALVDRVAAAFRSTGGEIKPLVRTILTSDEFKASRGTKFKPPFRFVVSALRTVGADTHAHAPLIEYLTRMGQGVFQYPTPDGYPDQASPWLGTLMWRWNFAFALAADSLPTVTVPWNRLLQSLQDPGSPLKSQTLFRHFTGHDPSPAQRDALAEASPGGVANQDLRGVLLASPAFQKY